MSPSRRGCLVLTFFFATVFSMAQTQTGHQAVIREPVDSLSAGYSHQATRDRNLDAAVESFVLGGRESAECYFRAAMDPLDSVRLAKLDSLLDVAPRRGHPSPVVAGAMSAIVPGTGQCYAGQPLDGLNSLGLIAGLTGATLFAPGLIFLTFPLSGRCYLSGIQHAVGQAETERNARQNLFLNKVLGLYDAVPSSLTASIAVERPSKKNYFQDVPKSGWSGRELGFALAGYKQFISSQDGDVCTFEPSCSVYMVEALRQEGPVVGFMDGVDRLLRCRPFVYNEANDPFSVTHPTADGLVKKPWLAAFYSGLIPGLGKVYTGEWKDGLYACAVVSAFSWLTYRFAEKKGFSPYTVLYGSMAFSFYIGNIYGSWKSAIRHR